MRGSTSDLPIAFEGEGVLSQQVEWGEMNVALEHLPAGMDTAPLFKGLPDDRCQCPHWGYILKGRMRVRYADREEILVTGDAYYLPPGHLPFFEEETEVIEFSPKGEYQKTMEVAERNLAAMQEPL
ncbi:MAG TPA: AraC family ligand binding domain-containing protein [Ktedonobacteraceae bacterium]|nr:AraC family ligand binding domain-containing protein [Ktedonobacteraceae bacterium]